MEPFERRATLAGCGAGLISQLCGTASGIPSSLATFLTHIYTGVTEVFEPAKTQTGSPLPTTAAHLPGSMSLNPDPMSSTSPNSPTASTTPASQPGTQPTSTSSPDLSSDQKPPRTASESTPSTAPTSNGAVQPSLSDGATYGTVATASPAATDEQHSNGATIAAAVLGVTIALIAIAVGIWLLRRRHRRRAVMSALEDYVHSSEEVEENPSIHDARYQKNPGYYLFSETHSLPSDGSKPSPRVSLPVSANTLYTISVVEDEKYNFRINPPL